MIGTGPAENRLDDTEAVNAIPLSDPDIIVADSLPSKRNSLPSKRNCVRSEFPVGGRLRRSNELSRSMLAASIALRFQAHDWAPAWPEDAQYRAGARGNRLLLFVSQTVHAINLADARAEFADIDCWSETWLKAMPKYV